jgi:hypothetical protein
MAQNISILEGGTAQQFGQVNKLKIANSGGGTSLWVPEDEVTTKSLHVDSNGTYYASQDECYGYDEVSVNIVDECFGYDDDGNLWDVEVDDDDFLEEEEMPVRIEVTTPPTKTSYIAYEPINTAGMVVTAYYADGTEYGAIPREEYTIDPIVAPVSTDEKKTSDLDTALPQPIPIGKCSFSGTFTRDIDGHEFKVIMTPSDNDVVGVIIYQPNGAVTLFIASPHQNSRVTIVSEWTYNGQKYTDTRQYPVSGSFTYNGQTVYYNGNVPNAGISMYADHATPKYPLPYIYPEATFYGNGEDAWTMVYGELHRSTEITVIWVREDGEELTDTFEIEVSDPPIPPVSGDDSGGGGSSGGSW